MPKIVNRYFDPETIEVLRIAMDEAWASLLPRQQALISKTDLAERILALASIGERDPNRLRTAALNGMGSAAP